MEKDYKTSVAYMLEIAKADIERHAAPDQLRTFQHDPAPERLEASSTPGGGHVNDPNSSGGSQTKGTSTPGSGDVGDSNTGGGNQTKENQGPRFQTVSVGDGMARKTSDEGRLDRSSELIDSLSEVSDYGKDIARVFWHGLNVTLTFRHSPANRNILRSARIGCWRVAKGMAKAADALETAQRLCTLAKNVHAAGGKMQEIVRSRDPFNVKTARLGAEVAAVSLKTIAQIGWEAPHHMIGYSRTAAAFFGADVTHPSFRTYPRSSWRAWTSWQAVNFLDARVGYLTESVYDGDTLYAFIHTHVH